MTDDATDRGGQEAAIREDPSLLNNSFYASEPAAHFEKRLLRLLHEPTDDDLDLDLLGDVAARLGRPVESFMGESSSVPGFVAVEMELLLHHVSETLLRLYLGHQGEPPCPWLAIAAIRSPKRFKKLVQRVVETSDRDLRGPVMSLFFNDWKSMAEDDTPTQSMGEESQRIACAFLRAAAERHLGDAGFYNAAKHGFAVQSIGQHLGLRMGDDESESETVGPADNEDVAEFGWSGPTIGYLVEREQGDSSERLYVNVTQWVEYADQVASLVMLLELMHNLWSIARCRYTESSTCQINTWAGPTPRTLGFLRQNTLARVEETVALRKLSSAARTLTLKFYKDPPAPSDS